MNISKTLKKAGWHRVKTPAFCVVHDVKEISVSQYPKYVWRESKIIHVSTSKSVHVWQMKFYTPRAALLKVLRDKCEII